MRSIYLSPLATLRNAVLPAAFIDGMLRIVVGLDGGHVAVKLADTCLSIALLNAGIAVLNGLLFGQNARLAERVRVPRLLLDLARLVVVLVGAAIIVAKVWNVDVSNVFAALGVGSIVIGLSLQDTLGSIFSGLALVSARQIHVGDWIEYGSDEGEVLAMNWRAVKVRTSAGDVLYVPNGVISEQSVRVLTLGQDTTTLNASALPLRRIAGSGDGADDRGGAQHARLHLDPPPAAQVNAFDESGIEYVVAVRASDPRELARVRSESLANLWFTAQRAGLSFTGTLKTAADHAPRTARQPVAAMAEMLARVGAFDLGPDGLERLARHARFGQYRAGQTIVDQGAVTGEVSVVVSGRAAAVFAAADGSEMTLHGFEPGQWMMAKSAFQGRGTPYTFRAVTQLEAVAIPLADLREVCLTDVALARAIEQILTARKEAAARVIAKAAPEGHGVGLNDRMELMRGMFRS